MGISKKKLHNKIKLDIQSTKEVLWNANLVRDENNYTCQILGKDKFVISFSNKDQIINNILYQDNVQISDILKNILDHRQYFLMFYDKSIVQFDYIIESDVLIKERLLFIKKHNRFWSPEYINELELNDDNWFDNNNGIPIVIRFDYSIEGYKSKLHPKSHLTISNYQTCRIPLTYPVSFSKFIKFILFQFYGIEYTGKVDSKMFPRSIDKDEEEFMHISWR